MRRIAYIPMHADNASDYIKCLHKKYIQQIHLLCVPGAWHNGKKFSFFGNWLRIWNGDEAWAEHDDNE